MPPVQHEAQGPARVVLRWTFDERSRLLRFTWQEFDGPPVEKPSRVGFGGTLIERSLPGATVHRDFASTGLVCTFELEVPQLEGEYEG